MKEIRIGKSWISFGYYLRSIGLGFHIDRHTLDIEFLFLWIAVQF